MKILLFGIAKDIVGNQFLEDASFKAKNVAELKQELIQKYPEFAKLSSLAVAVDEEYAGDEQQISADNEIAIIPPVSGG